MIHLAHNGGSWNTAHSFVTVSTAFGDGDGGGASGTVGHDTIEQSQAAKVVLPGKGNNIGSIDPSASTDIPAPSGSSSASASDSLRSVGKDIKSTGSVITGTSALTNSKTAIVKPVSSTSEHGDALNAKEGSIESLRTNLNV